MEPGALNGDAQVVTTTTLTNYLRDVVPLVLGGSEGELSNVLSQKDSIEKLARFAEENQCPILMVYRNASPPAEEDPEADSEDKHDDEREQLPPWSMSLQIAFSNHKLSALGLVKRGAHLTTDRSLGMQLRLVSFAEGQPFETLHSLLHNAFNPYLTSAIDVQKAGDKVGIKGMKRAIADLELSLVHLQQDIDIPDIHLPINGVVKAVISKALEEQRKADVADFGDKVTDPQFLNALQRGVSRWIREMQKVTKLDRDPASGTAMQEISFWLNLERALYSIKDKRDSPEIGLTLDVLKHGKRFHATVSFDSDTGLQNALDTVNNYNALMKDFPLNGLLAAHDTDSIKTALVDIFSHLKKIRNTKYPIPRALKLVQAISRDLSDQLLKVLADQGLMHVSYQEFERIIQGCTKVFQAWEDEDEKIRNTLRDMLKKKRDDTMKTFRRVTPEHRSLQERLDQLSTFRKQHEQLRTVIARVLKPSGGQENEGLMSADDVNAIGEVNLAYDDVKEIDALNLSTQGEQAWESAKKRYDERIDRVETRITARLRDQLGTAKNANEMFRIFSKFNALFVRPRIRGAIREYQTQLIQRVKQDIAALHEKFKVQYLQTANSKMSEVRDLPPVSGQIIWARQIDRQLTTYLQRVEDVLGRGWENHVEGRTLKEEGDSFRAKLDTQALFDSWSAEVQGRQLGVSGRIFEIEHQRTERETRLQLQVNFHSQIITLAKEVRNLKWLGFRVPLVIVNKALQANHLYPFAISLTASIRTYQQTNAKLDLHGDVRPLVASYHKAIQNRLGEGVALRWESYRLETFVQNLAEEVFTFQEKVDDLIAANSRVTELVNTLERCELEAATLNAVLEDIQKIVDDLNLKAYVNIAAWVSRLDAQVEGKLALRLSRSIRLWNVALERFGADHQSAWDRGDLDELEEGEELPGIDVLSLEIIIRSQVMMLNPPAEQAREHLLGQLQRHLAVIAELPRIQSSRYQVGMEPPQGSERNYRSLLVKTGGTELVRAYELIEATMAAVAAYVKVWLQYQALWDMQTDTILHRLGDDLERWRQLLVEIKKARRTFDTHETSACFGPIAINFAQVQTRVNMKYDALHRELLGKFGGRLGRSMSAFHKTVTKSRLELESLSVDSASTNEAVNFISVLQDIKRHLGQWGDDLETFQAGQKILERQRYPFPEDWLYIDNIEGEWQALNDILARKDQAIQGQVGTLQMKVVDEDRQIEKRMLELLGDWEQNKPIGGDINPEQATNTLAIYESRFVRLKEDFDGITKAKIALDLDVKNDHRLETGLDELKDLKSSWSELARIWTNINELKAIPWSAVVPRKIRTSLDDLANQLKNLPSRIRSYASYEYTMTTIKKFLKANRILMDLKSDALKERHWKSLCKELRVDWHLSDLLLGQVWEANLVANEKIIAGVMLVAQGENALEEYLKQIREEWAAYELELVNYQNKTKLIKGWDDLFEKCKEHINSLTAMKLSPYFKVFEEEANSWDDKLNRINSLFDVWIDVQRRWVYLEGIFLGSGSADIKILLPTETSRFQSISTEFLALMKKVAKSPMVLEVLNVPSAQKSLERLADLLAKIQKALGEYLEKERSSFPRFYFVGDEDLLEIIGNSKNVERLQKHFKKMFAGVQTILINEEGTEVVGLASREDERVMFKTPVTLKDQKINQWLTNVEKEMRVSLAKHLAEATVQVEKFRVEGFDLEPYLDWMDHFQAQLVVLAAQVSWSSAVEVALADAEKGGQGDLEKVVSGIEKTLSELADTVLRHQEPIRRKKLEHLIIELVHQRDVTRKLIKDGVGSPQSFAWLSQMRFYYDPKNSNVLEQLSIRMADAHFHYGFEYLGLVDKLVQTPLTDRCYLTMTQALKARQGGAPFGPAGTGKTESVKSLGAQLGRFVLVFNCDETFDSQAMTRIFIGLCQVGAWGCFDEFNRLEERQLSAVSQQIQSIQLALKAGTAARGQPIEVGFGNPPRPIPVSQDMAIFITMNPGYAGRSNLPDNLKKLFRNLAMTKPDRQLIAQVMLYSQGFRTAEALSRKVVPLFILCAEQLSAQPHYDFGLRAVKSVLVSAGNIKRASLANLRKEATLRGEAIDEAAIAASIDEEEVVIQSISQTMIPKLVAEDTPLLQSLLADVFPGVRYQPLPMDDLKAKILEVCEERHLVVSEQFLVKVLQLYQVTTIHHGLMLVGPSGTGKSAAWSVLLEALQRLEGREGVAYVVDPKAITKDDLYGSLDPTTREWTDGLFTHVIRKIVDNVRNELSKRQWVIFDGDVDPEWVENLNSVLDDNKLLTLPNGERLNLPPNIRIIFEVEDLKHATLATVSRCGMVWFSEDTLSLEMYCQNFLSQLRSVSLDPAEQGTTVTDNPMLQVQTDVAEVLAPFLTADGLVARCLDYAAGMDHIMEYTHIRAVNALFSMLNQIARATYEYNQSHPDFPLSANQVEAYASKRLLYSVVWSLVGDCKMADRTLMTNYIRGVSTVDIPSAAEGDIIDFFVTLPEGDWCAWETQVPVIEVETHRIAGTDVVVPTLDTQRHEDLLYTWLSEHLPIVLCGPPGSGKTMTLFNSLRKLPDFLVVGLNFSNATTPELLLKTLDQYCEYRKTPNGTVLAPTAMGKWLVVFCDEVNLPALDKYGTARVITFMRQMIEQGGFWRTADHTFVHLERIQFVGACNPPTDPGRVPLSLRFLRHVPVVYVDYPGPLSLKMIYGTFTRALLRMQPQLRQYADPLTDAMVDFFSQSQQRFTADMQPHYIYSPREMTRWVKGVAEAIAPVDGLPIEGLVRIWAHEALRLFQDRLVYDEERRWTDEHIDAVAQRHFPNIDHLTALQRPILYSCWLSKDYVPVEQEELREYVKARLKVFYEEELDVPLVLFDEVLDHVLRMDRIFRQNQGHMLLIGVSGSGKTTLSRFVAWMNGLSVFQVKVHNQYTAEDFDDDLRQVLRRSGTKGERIVFIMDEGNVVDTAFLERMNTLLANGEVPGLFEGDEYTVLMNQCKEGSQRDGLVLNGNDELYKWFCKEVMNNLHVVFTMNPSEGGLQDRAATSPALFNRCVLDWFGDWPDSALFQVALEFLAKIDLERADYEPPMAFPVAFEGLGDAPSHRHAIMNACVFVHKAVKQAARRLAKREGQVTHITPRHFLEFINQFVHVYAEKRRELEDQQLHLNVGLKKIEETMTEVADLQQSLAVKEQELKVKNDAANEKLQQMVGEQKAAEEKKVQSEQLEKDLAEKQAKAAERRTTVEEELAQVEPAVREAKKAVSGIKKQHLTELKNLPKPPEIIKVVLESVLTLLGEKQSDWRFIRTFIVRDDFIPRITGFNSEQITSKVKDNMQKFLSNPNYTFEKAMRASQAAGPLVKWALAQISYATMLLQIEPLRNELKALDGEALRLEEQKDQVAGVILELEQSIARYKEEYAVLIGEVQTIKTNLTAVNSRVGRSRKLLDSLGDERGRWSQECNAFATAMATIVGDVLLNAAFLGYAGYFDQRYRETLFAKWQSHLAKARIDFKPEISIVEYLSTPDERMRWKRNHLPDDDLCTENAIMLKRYIRYPLVIDPSGQAAEFVLKEFSDRKITKTSFLDPAFRKNLESALRFGTALLVQDAESYDPILNPVLNREVKRAGGRVLINLGDQEIDLSPTFKIILSTRNPAANFSPDLCSRVTLINFTVTRASLQSQCLNQVLRAERADIDTKRSDLLKLQGEYRLKLRQLEKDLLNSLNDAEGSILDDDRVITELEKLKKESTEVQQKSADTDKVMAEVDAVSAEYHPLSQKCALIFFALEQLHTVHFLYRFSLSFFFDIFQKTLHDNARLTGVKDYKERLQIIIHSLFSLTNERVIPGMLNEHRMAFAVALANVFTQGTEDEIPAELMTFFMQGAGIPNSDGPLNWLVPHVLNADQAQSGGALCQLAQMSSIADTIRTKDDDFKAWVQSPFPDAVLEGLITPTGTPVIDRFQELLVLQAFRPDRVIAKCREVAEAAFGPAFVDAGLGGNALAKAVESEVDSKTPLLLCGVSGYDASTNVQDLCVALNKQKTDIAIGSAEGFVLAEKAINSAAKTGRWVLLKNVHLAPQWLVTLEKKLITLNTHPNFRLFLTAELHPKLPVNLLRGSCVFVFEPAAGVKANLLRTLNAFPASRVNAEPAERGRIYLLLAWLHAVVQERLRYAPLGWTKKYEFGEADLRTASDTIDMWISDFASGRSHVDPEKIPWEALQTLISLSIYGGRVGNEIDQRLLNSFVKSIFTKHSFDAEFALVKKSSDSPAILAPDGFRREQFLDWAAQLPETQSPTWLGLPANAEVVLLTSQAILLASNLLKLQNFEDEDTGEDSEEASQSSTAIPGWMRNLNDMAKQWMSLLPESLTALERSAEKIKDPMFRYFERECTIGLKLLQQVRRDLGDVVAICAGTAKQTNYLRTLMAELHRGIIPESWKKYKVPTGLAVHQWVQDFGLRCKQLHDISSDALANKPLQAAPIWLGGLFNPEAYITATRQAVSQQNEWSLEKLVLEVDVRSSETDLPKDTSNSFLIHRLRLEGATCSGRVVELTDAATTVLPLTIMRWKLGPENGADAGAEETVGLPLYLNATRAQHISTMRFKPGAGTHENDLYGRGVALLCSSLSGIVG